MNKTLEQMAAEEKILDHHHVLSAIQGSIRCVQDDLQQPNRSKDDLALAKGEIGHAYLLIGAVEHLENKRLPITRQLVNHYARQLGYAVKEK